MRAMSVPVYDVCVIGSEAAGGMVTHALTQAGAKVLLVEAGKRISATDLLSHEWPWQLPYRGLRGEKQALFSPPDLRDAIRYEDSDPGVGVSQVHVLGGRTMHWNAVVLRYAPQDFRERSLNGWEVDWPLGYDELAPYYDRAERLMGVCGQDDGLDILPAGKSYAPPITFRCSEEILRRSCRALDIPVIPVRKALLRKGSGAQAPCHYCGHCMDGCDVGAIFNTPGHLLPQAFAPGNLTLRQNSLARELLLDQAGKIRAVSLVDRLTRQESEVRARVFVLCCATVETARLLLNSRSPRRPDGLANGSGVVGRHLHGHLTNRLLLYLDELKGRAPRNEDGATDHAYIPRFNHRLDWAQPDVGSYAYQVNFIGYQYPAHATRVPGYGARYKQKVRAWQPGLLQLGGYGKVFARPENRITVHPDLKDAFGIPLPVVQFRFGEQDRAVWKAMNASTLTITERMPGLRLQEFGDGPSGFASHEVGTVRMGRDPATSAVNPYGQAHEVPNLFVSDGSTFPTSSEKNPTLTIMALSLRTADFIARQRRMGAL